MLSSKSLLVVLFSAAPLSLALPQYPTGALLAPLYHPPVDSGDLVNGSYIVMLKDGIQLDTFDSHINFIEHVTAAYPLQDADNGLQHVWNSHAMQGYAGRFSEDVVELIRRRPEVDYIEQDQMAYAEETQQNPPWGLARISHRGKLTEQTSKYYHYVRDGGKGAMVYVLDTGVYTRHVEFEGRAFWGTSMINGEPNEDLHSHGTHCAGTVASRKYGVAKQAHITAVKVLGKDGRGPTSGIIAGVDWTIKHARGLAKQNKYRGFVISMSLGGGQSRAMNDAVNRAFKAGLHVAVAAGNDRTDACSVSPASANLPITVASSTIDDTRSSFSNFGKCVDVFAPGSNVLSTGIAGPEATLVKSGTSMATPHVAGLIAYWISIYPHKEFNPAGLSSNFAVEDNLKHAYATAYDMLPDYMSVKLPTPSSFISYDNVGEDLGTYAGPLTPERMKRALFALATKNAIQDVRGSPNRLAFNNVTIPKGKDLETDDLWYAFD